MENLNLKALKLKTSKLKQELKDFEFYEYKYKKTESRGSSTLLIGQDTDNEYIKFESNDLLYDFEWRYQKCT